MKATNATKTTANATKTATLEGLASEHERLRRRVRRAEVRLGATWALAAVACAGAFLIGDRRDGHAQLKEDDLTTRVKELDIRLRALEAKTQDVTRTVDPATGVATVRFSGVNVQIVNGLGATNGDPARGSDYGVSVVNGAGNLIIGYNEQFPSGGRARTGSHNLVVGSYHGYSSWGGLLAGYSNSVSAPTASVTGGMWNSASAPGASVSGGLVNYATDYWGSVSGGVQNTAGMAASVSGGSGRSAPYWANWTGGGLTQTY